MVQSRDHCSREEALTRHVFYVSALVICALLHYLDDFFGGAPAQCYQQAVDQFEHFKASVTYLEVKLSLRKFARPGQQMELLGIDWCTIRQRFAIPDDKRTRYILLIRSVQSKRREQGVVLDKLHGSLMYSANVHWCGPAFLNELRRVRYTVKNPNHYCKITPLLRQELDLWVWMLMMKNCISFKWYMRRYTKHETDFSIYTDASGSGLGGYNCKTRQWFQYSIPNRFNGPDFDVNRYEMASIYFACMLWGHQSAHKCIHLWTDNQPCKWALIKKKSRSPYVRWLLRAICAHSVALEYLFYVDYINTKENTVADRLSRGVAPFEILAFDGKYLEMSKQCKVGHLWGRLCRVWYGKKMRDDEKLAHLLSSR